MYQITEGKLRKALKFLKKDLHDDWYCDLQNYEDISLDFAKLTLNINNRIKHGRGVYEAQKSVLLNIPKANGGFRYTLELSPIDRIAYHVFGLELVELLDGAISFRVLSQRKSSDSKTLFKPFIEQWNKFENYTRISAAEKYIIETDLSNYFENIQLDLLRFELVDAASTSNLTSSDFLRCMYLIDSVISILKVISFDGTKGLPQNRDISHFLANIYMRHLDKKLNNQTYFRYVDDIRIITSTRAEANQLMLVLVEALRNYGLAINGTKTRILVPGSKDHDECINDFAFEEKKTDAMLNSGKRRFVMQSFHDIFRMTNKLLDDRQINDRHFRFYVNRLVTFLNAKDVSVPKKLRNEIAVKLVDQLKYHPECADQICVLVQALGQHTKLQKSLITWAIDPDNLTYEWAVYSIIKTLTLQNCSSLELQRFCRAVLDDRKHSDPIVGISAVFLNKKASSKIEARISKENSHFLQRHLLIALSFTPPSFLKDRKTPDRIHDEFIGQHFNLNKATRQDGFALVRPSERLTHKELIKEISNYV